MTEMDLLRLFGYASRGVEEVDGEVFIDVELDSISKYRIPACTCEAPDVVKHGKRVVRFKDVPLQRQPTYIRMARQRFRCRSCGAILLNELMGIEENHHMTQRFWRQIAEDAVRRTFIDAAIINGVDEKLVRRIFKEHAAFELESYKPTLPRVLGMDEKVVSGEARFVIGDVEKRTMLDMQPSRKQAPLISYFDQMEHRHEVEVITQDMYWGYKTINERYFRKALIVVDKFHVVRYANDAVESVRKAIQRTLDNDGRIEMKRKIRLLAARPSRLTDDGRRELKRLFKLHPALEMAVTHKEWFYDLYESQNRAEAEKSYQAWLDLLPQEMERYFAPIISYMHHRRWRPLIFNYFEHPYTNAYVEALNGLIDQINRSGRGYDFDVLRAKALLRYGEVYRAAAYSTEGVEFVHFGHGIDLSTFEADLEAGSF